MDREWENQQSQGEIQKSRVQLGREDPTPDKKEERGWEVMICGDEMAREGNDRQKQEKYAKGKVERSEMRIKVCDCVLGRQNGVQAHPGARECALHRGRLWGGEQAMDSGWAHPAALASCWTESGRRCGSSFQPLAGRSPETSPADLRWGEGRKTGEEEREELEKGWCMYLER